MDQPLRAQADALEHLLKAKSLLHDNDLQAFHHQVTEQWQPRNGARLCARAWTDRSFKAQLLTDGRAAAASMGLDMPEHHRSLVVLENTAEVHNVICCTLCSCTAFSIIGMAPGWYKDLEYRARVVREARTVLAEMGLHLPQAMRIRVWDTTTDTRYMVLPYRPAHTQGWTVQALEALITKESMIGVARLEQPPANAAVTAPTGAA
ncbi:MAG: nitrile hydratase subunit alpha [Betaproteobacteria bacterium]|nr:nitrile hydratase subunit alpha [Betaproteobacteria bacterium]